MSDIKMWGKDPFWGLGYEFDPQWLLTDEQKKLQKTLIDLCQSTMRENAVESDKKLLYPRKNFQTLAKHGFLGLIVPKELGGMGQNHVAAAMAVEIIARYGCPSTAMCYTMHLGAVAAALFRHHNNPALKDILSRIDKDCLVGTLSYSDPETGSHFWYPVSSSAKKVDGGWQVTKKASWTTSGGFADWYIVQTTSPDFQGNYANLSSSSATRWRRIPPTGTGSACAAISPARWSSTTGPFRRTAWSARSMTAPIPTTNASIRSSCSAPRPAGTASRWR
jgi:Acyl-CoA dehydrogenase, N-terminal domain